MGSGDRKEAGVARPSLEGKCVQFGFALGSPNFCWVSAIPGGVWGEGGLVCWLAGSQPRERQSLEAGRLGFKSQLLHFLALWI